MLILPWDSIRRKIIKFAKCNSAEFFEESRLAGAKLRLKIWLVENFSAHLRLTNYGSDSAGRKFFNIKKPSYVLSTVTMGGARLFVLGRGKGAGHGGRSMKTIGHLMNAWRITGGAGGKARAWAQSRLPSWIFYEYGWLVQKFGWLLA